MKKNTSPILRTILAVSLCLLGAVLIWLISQYSTLQAPVLLQRAGSLFLFS